MKLFLILLPFLKANFECVLGCKDVCTYNTVIVGQVNPGKIYDTCRGKLGLLGDFQVECYSGATCEGFLMGNLLTLTCVTDKQCQRAIFRQVL